MALILIILGLLAFFFYNQITGIILVLSALVLVIINLIKKFIELSRVKAAINKMGTEDRKKEKKVKK